MNFLKVRVFPILSGFVLASVVMMLFEYTNSLLYPFPEGFDTRNLEMVREFAKMMPWTAYILVGLGWFFGSYVSGFISTKYAPKGDKKNAIISLLLLLIAALVNTLMFTHPLWFIIFGNIALISGTYGGWKMIKCKKNK